LGVADHSANTTEREVIRRDMDKHRVFRIADFRWNTRTKLGFNDSDRTNVALKNIGGKRLTYRRIDA
jgi:hypothetical protein